MHILISMRFLLSLSNYIRQIEHSIPFIVQLYSLLVRHLLICEFIVYYYQQIIIQVANKKTEVMIRPINAYMQMIKQTLRKVSSSFYILPVNFLQLQCPLCCILRTSVQQMIRLSDAAKQLTKSSTAQLWTSSSLTMTKTEMKTMACMPMKYVNLRCEVQSISLACLVTIVMSEQILIARKRLMISASMIFLAIVINQSFSELIKIL